ncbi:MAG: hypothetical protein HY646_06040 [Acidobacteria bacterium]|nr:hypothetical protein [Acidobacteriota bacterium]
MTDCDTLRPTDTPINGLAFFSCENNWTTKPEHEYRSRELWYPLAHAVTQWENEFHELMLRDHLRMASYKRAIRQTVRWLVAKRAGEDREVVRVIDLGAGYGILSYWVVKYFKEAQAEIGTPAALKLRLRVYAIEGNPITAGEAYRRLGYEGMTYAGPRWSNFSKEDAAVLVCNTSSYEFSEYLSQHRDVVQAFDELLSEGLSNSQEPTLGADLVVSEIFGSVIDTEDGVAILRNVLSRHLLNDGVCIPYSAKTWLVPFEVCRSKDNHGPDVLQQVSLHRTPPPIQQKPRSLNEYFKEVDLTKYSFCYDCIIPIADHLAPPQEGPSWFFGPATEEITVGGKRQTMADTWHTTYVFNKEFDAAHDAILAGLKGYFTMELTHPRVDGERVILDIGQDDIQGRQTTDCWKHLFLPAKNPIAVRRGDKIRVKYARESKDLEPDVLYIWNIANNGRNFEDSTEQRYPTERPFLPKRLIVLGDLANRLCTYAEEKVGAKLILPDTDKKAEELLRKSVESLLRHPSSSNFPSFFLGWPSSEDRNRPRYLWYDVQPGSGETLFEPASKLPTSGNRFRYVVDNNKPQGQKVTISDDTFYSVDEYATWEEELRRYMRPSLYEENSRRGRKESFVSLALVDSAVAFSANVIQFRRLEIALYLLQTRILIELLAQDHEQMGRVLGSAEQAQALAHEVGQVSQLLRVGTPADGSVVWPATIMEDLIANSNSTLQRSAIFSEGLFSPLNHAYKAATSYIEIISDAKHSQSPFGEIAGQPLGTVLGRVSEFTKRASLAYWIRRQDYAIKDLDQFTIEVERARKLQETFLGVWRREKSFRIFLDRPQFQSIPAVLPSSRIYGFISSNGVFTEVHEGAKVGLWIGKMVSAALMNTLKYSSNSASRADLEDVLPIAIIADADCGSAELRIVIANKWPSWNMQDAPSFEDGTGLVLKVFQRHLANSGITGISVHFADRLGQFHRSAVGDQDEVGSAFNPNVSFSFRDVEAQHLGLKDGDNAFCSFLVFRGISGQLLTGHGRPLEKL